MATTQTADKIWSTWIFEGPFLESKSLEYTLRLQDRYDISEHQNDNWRTEGGLGIKTSPKVSLWFGTTWVSVTGSSEQEYRLWEQAKWEILATNTLKMVSRTRLEERKSTTEPGISNRFRQLLRLSFPNALALAISPYIENEIFFNLNHPVWVNNQMFDQNRLLLALNIPMIKNVSINLGYLNQYILNQPMNEANNILYLSINVDT